VAYGTTLFGGASNNGAAYQLTPVSGTSKWTESVIYSFMGGTDGANPAGALILGADGVLYGTTIGGGSANAGTAFQLTPPIGGSGAWAKSTLHSFMGAPDGANPHAGLLLGTTGVLYGTTANGGTGTCKSGCGTAFSLTPPATPGGAWTETVLHSFVGSDGANPYASLTAGPPDVLYGTTVNGGASGFGEFFEVTTGTTSVVKVLYSFTGGTDGANPYAALTSGKGSCTARRGMAARRARARCSR
jgi:uncharacterized repeat protein (TIGR03803 family)